MDVLLSRTCSPMADPEAQPQQDCAWSTIPIPIPHPILTLDRGPVLSRHDDPPIPSLLPDDTPPAYTYPPPIPPISGSDPSESATNRTVVGYNLRLYAIVIAFILTVALLATAGYFSFFKHPKVYLK